MQRELIVDCYGCRAKIDKDTIREFLDDIVDYFNESVVDRILAYLEDGSVGVVVVEHGIIFVNYLTGENLVRVSIYYRKPFSMPDLEERLNMYFIPQSTQVIFKEMT